MPKNKELKEETKTWEEAGEISHFQFRRFDPRQGRHDAARKPRKDEGQSLILMLSLIILIVA